MSTTTDIPLIELNSGQRIPQLGFGTFQIEPSETAALVSHALSVGYRHIDTAQMYGNEAGVGAAIRESSIDRDEIFVTTKLNNSFHEPGAARAAFERSLMEMGLGYVDLFLIHWPLPTVPETDYLETWKTLEEFAADGRARSIGVSNFQVDHLERLDRAGTTTPAVNQIELHPRFLNREVDEYGKHNGIPTEAWSPLGQGELLDDPVVTGLADELDRTAAQVVLRWQLQRGNIVFPKSANEARIEENFDVFGFDLSDAQIGSLDALDRGADGRIGPHPDHFDMIPD